MLSLPVLKEGAPAGHVLRSVQVKLPLIGVMGTGPDPPAPVLPPVWLLPPLPLLLPPAPVVVAFGLTPAHPIAAAAPNDRVITHNRLDAVCRRIGLLRRFGDRGRGATQMPRPARISEAPTILRAAPQSQSGQGALDAAAGAGRRWAIMTTIHRLSLRLRMSQVSPLALLCVMGIAGCGGGLKYKVDDSAIDSVSSGEKQDVFAAQNDLEVARSEQRTVKTQLDELDRERSVAKNEKEQASLEVEKAGTEQESANASHDENRANAAHHTKEIADLGVKVSAAKMEWLDEKEDWLKASAKAADAHEAAAQAKVELAKAKLAQQKGIKPSGDFSVANFEDQWKDKNDDWQSAKKKADSEQKSTQEREAKWKEISTQQAKMKG
jgi:hypothetical protein